MSILDGNSEMEIESRADDIVALLNKEEAGQGDAAEAPQQQNSAPATAQDGGPEGVPADEQQDEAPVEPAKPALDPPKFWKAEDRDIFAKLPPETQQRIVAAAEEAHKAEARAIGEATQQRKVIEDAQKALETDRNTVAQERQRYAQTLTTLAQKLYSQDPVLLAETNTDWVQLWNDAPADAGRRQAMVQQRIGQINAFVQNLAKEHDELQGKTESERQAKVKTHMDEQEKLLVQKVPEWADQSVGAKAIADIRNDLVTAYGFDPKEVALFTDHRQALVARDAMLYRQLKATVDAEKAKTAKAAAAIGDKRVPAQAPRVARPGNANDTKEGQSERSKALINQAKKARSIHDKAALIADAL